MLICRPVSSRPFIVLQKEAISSPCNFATGHLTAFILHFHLPLTLRPMKMEDPFATSQICYGIVLLVWRGACEGGRTLRKGMFLPPKRLL